MTIGAGKAPTRSSGNSSTGSATGGLASLDRGTIRRFPDKATGLSEVQIHRPARRWRETGGIQDRPGGGRGTPFEHCYTAADIRAPAPKNYAYSM